MTEQSQAQTAVYQELLSSFGHVTASMYLNSSQGQDPDEAVLSSMFTIFKDSLGEEQAQKKMERIRQYMSKGSVG